MYLRSYDLVKAEQETMLASYDARRTTAITRRGPGARRTVRGGLVRRVRFAVGGGLIALGTALAGCEALERARVRQVGSAALPR